MGVMSDLDIALTPTPVRVRCWSQPTLAVHVSTADQCKRTIPYWWRAEANRWLTLEFWAMAPGCLMGEETT